MDALQKTMKAFFNDWEITWSFYLDMEKEMRRKLRKMHDDIRKNGQSLGVDILHEFDDIVKMYTSLLREGLLIRICSFVEYTMRELCTLLIPEYEDKYAKRKKSNWLEKNLALLKSTGITGIDPQDVSFFCDFITLRNYLVHSGGRIDRCGNPKKVRDTVERLQELGENQNTSIIGVTKNGYALLGEDILPEVFVRGEEIIRGIFGEN